MSDTNLPTKGSIFGREPAVLIGAVASLLAVLVAFGLDFLSVEQAGAIEAFLAAAASVWIAVHVRPVAPTLLTGLITAGATLAATYGFDLSQSQVGSLTAASVALMTLLVVRPQSTPKADPRPVGVISPDPVTNVYNISSAGTMRGSEMQGPGTHPDSAL